MSKLSDYITGKINFPIKKTGLSNSGWEIQSWKRKEENLIYECSLCDCKILPNDFLLTYTLRGYTIPIKRFDEIENQYEVLGFICRNCQDEITKYDQLYYG